MKSIFTFRLAGVSWSAWVFAVRTAVASLIALYIAMRMNLDDPKWAAITVWVVAQSSHGMSLSKSQYRIVGTALGAIAALMMTSLFAQTPELFLLSLAIWIGLCTGLAASMRNFRAYAAVLAGYTAAIVGLDTVSAPLHAFDIALARFLDVVLGILAEAMLSAIFAPGAPMREVRKRLSGYAQKVSEACVRALRGEANGPAIHVLVAGALELDTAAEYAAAASPEVRRITGHVRAATAAMLTQLVAVLTVQERMTRQPGFHDPLVDEARHLLECADTAPTPALATIATLQARVDHALAVEAASHCGSRTPRLCILERIGRLLRGFEDLVARTALLDQMNPPPSSVNLAFHRDPVLAWHNGIRAFTAVLAAAAFWIESEWPSGAAFVTTVGVVSALFSTRPNSVAAATGWLKGAACAGLVGVLCNFVLLPQATDFVSLACIAGPFMVAAGLAMRHPKTASMAGGFALFFWNFTSLSNTSRISDVAFLNSALATLVGIAWATAAFLLLFPGDWRSEVARLHRASRQDLIDIAGNPEKWTTIAWLSRTADRLGRQRTATPPRPEGTARSSMDAEARELLAAWAVGDGLLALHAFSARRPLARRFMSIIRKCLRRMELERLERFCGSFAHRLALRASRCSESRRPELLRGAILLQTFSVSLREYVEVSRVRAKPAASSQ